MSEQLTADVLVNAPVTAVFAAMTDWPAHGAWMRGTSLRVTRGDGRSVGSELAARAGIGPVAVVDTVEITRWEAPWRIELQRHGPLAQGTLTGEVVELPGGRARLVWTERLSLPVRPVSRWGWPVLRPVVSWGLSRSLATLGRMVETGRLPRDGDRRG